MIPTLATALAFALGADGTPSPSPSAPPLDPERVTPGLLGLVSFLFLVVAVVLLYRSMRTQMRKVSPDLPPGPRERAADGPAEPQG